MTKIGLLISDDPDDYQMFYEALQEVSTDTILLNIGVNTSAARYLKEAAKPDFIIIDLSMNTSESEDVVSMINRDTNLKLIPKLALIEDQPFLPNSMAGYIHKGTDYGELKTTLKKFLSGSAFLSL